MTLNIMTFNAYAKWHYAMRHLCCVTTKYIMLSVIVLSVVVLSVVMLSVNLLRVIMLCVIYAVSQLSILCRVSLC